MAPFSWSRWLRSLFHPKIKTYRKVRRSLSLEHLETRLAPATYIWTGGSAVNALWSNPKNWAGGVAPTGSPATLDDLVFPSGVAVTNTNNDLPVVNGQSATFNSITFSGNNYILSGNGITLGNNTPSASGAINVGAGLNNETISLNIQLADQATSRQFITVNSSAMLTISGNLSGATGAQLTKEGAGVLKLTADNSAFTGPIALDTNAGIIQITNANALGGSTGNVTVSAGSQLQLINITGTIQSALKLNGSGISNDGALLNVSDNVVAGKDVPNNWGGPITLDSDAFFGANAGDLIISGVITDLGAGHSVSKAGAGEVTFVQANTYRGTTSIYNGILDIQNAGSLGSGDSTAATQVNVFSNLVTQGTLQLDDPKGIGFTVANKILSMDPYPTNLLSPPTNTTILNEPANELGEINNFSGSNTWSGPVHLGNPGPSNGTSVFVSAGEATTLTFSGVVSDPNGVMTLTKIAHGTLDLTSSNTYRGGTNIYDGILEIQDSQALGPVTSAVTIDNPNPGVNGHIGTLELAVDNIPDSVTGNTTSLLVSNPVTVNNTGNGFSGLGSIYSHSGINTFAGSLKIDSVTVAQPTASIGVDPAANPIGAPYTYDVTANGTVLDDSLTFSGTISNGPFTNTVVVSKVGGGQLILPTANAYIGPTKITSGWVTVENSQAFGGHEAGLGDTQQPYVSVYQGAAIHLLPVGSTTSLNLPYNLNLAGSGATTAYSLTSNQGALENLAGINTISGLISLNGNVGLGVEQIYNSTSGDPNFSSNPLSQLTETGSIQQITPVINITAPSSGGPAEDDNIIDVGTIGGKAVIDFNAYSIPDDLRVYYGPIGTPGSKLLYDSSTGTDPQNPTSSNEAIITVTWTATSATATAAPVDGTGYRLGPVVSNYGPLTSTQIEIVVNQGGSLQDGTVWDYTAQVFPNSPATGSITKLGSQLLVLQGDGTYTGGIDIKQGVVRDANNTGLGTGDTTTVETGAALELSQTLARNNGGISAGLQTSGEHLILNGPGNTTVNPLVDPFVGIVAPLTVINGDQMWRGPITMNTTSTIFVPTNSRLTFAGVVDDATNTAASGSDINFTGGGELDISGTNTYRGSTYVKQGVLVLENSQGLGSTPISQVETVTVTGTAGTFTLTYNGQTTISLPFNATPTAVAAALNALSSISGVNGFVTVTQVGNVYYVGFGGQLTGFNLSPMTATGSGGATATVAVSNIGAGATTVSSGASLVLQGGISVGGKPLMVQGSGLATASSLQNQWFNVGPAPISGNITTQAGLIAGSGTVAGRVTSVAVDPTDANVIYIATGGGGAWKTINGGQTWVQLFDGGNGSTIYAGAIAVAPSDPRVIYLGTGETDNTSDSYYGTGVYKSTDSGRTWTLLKDLAATNQNPLYGQGISAIVVDPNKSNLIYVASSDLTQNGATGAPGIYRYNGANWFDMTAVVSTARATATGTTTPPPHTPGPDDDFRINFPTVNATWSDLILLPTQAYNLEPGANGGFNNPYSLYAALGTSNGSPTANQLAPPPPNPYDTIAFPAGGLVINAVYRIDNPQANDPIWFVGNGIFVPPTASAPAQELNIDSQAGDFPNPGTNVRLTNGNIKLAGVSRVNPATGSSSLALTTVYAAISHTPNEVVAPGNGVNNSALDGQLFEIRKSTDGGQTWGTTITPPANLNYLGNLGYYASAIVAKLTDPTNQLSSAITIYVAGSEQQTNPANPAVPSNHTEQVLTTQDTGAGAPTWVDISVDLKGNSPHTGAHSLAFTASGQVLDATDGGIWSLNPVSDLWTDINGNLSNLLTNSVASNPTNINAFVAGFENNGEAVDNGNQTWNLAAIGDGGTTYYDPTNPNTIYEAADGVLIKSTTGGTLGSFKQLIPGQVQPFYPTDPTYSPYYEAYQSYVSDGNYPNFINQNFTRAIDTTALGNFALVVDPINSQRILMGGKPLTPPNQPFPTPQQLTASALYESFNGGTTWSDLLPPAALNGVTQIAIATDQGPYSPDPAFTSVTDLGANTYDPNTIYISDGSKVYLSKNNGTSWVNRTTNLPNGIVISDVVVDPRNRDIVYVTSSASIGSGLGRIFVSNNAGRSWSSITGNLPDQPVWTLTVDPRDGTLYAGTDNGVYSAGNSGISWSTFGVGLPQVSVRQVDLNLNLNTITLATYGRGVYQLALSNQQANAGAFTATSGASVWTGTVFLSAATTISANGTTVLPNTNSSSQLTIVGTITDATPGANYQLTKIGQGNVVLSGTNLYGGVTDIQQGNLVVQSPNALGTNTATSAIVETGAALELASNLNIKPIILHGDGISLNGHNTGALHNISNINTYNGTITLASNSTIGVDSGSSLAIVATGVDLPGQVGTITDGTNSFSLTKELTGTLYLTTADSYHGGTSVNQGVLNIQNAQALGAAGTLTGVLDGAQLQIQGGIEVANENLRISGSGIFGSGAFESTGGLNKWDGSVTLAQDAAFSPATNPPTSVSIGVLATSSTDGLVINGVISQYAGALTPIGLTKVGGGVLTLNNANTYAGVTSINAGAIRVENSGALGTGGSPPSGGTIVMPGAALQLDGSIAPLNIVGETVTLNGTGLTNTGALENFAGANTLGGSIILQSNTSIGVDGTSQLTVSGTVQDVSPTPLTPPTLTKLGTGTLVLPSANTFHGATFITNGTVNIQNSAALGSPTNEVQTISLTGASTGTFTVTFNGQTTAPLAFTSSAVQVMNALNALSSIGGVGGSVTVTLLANTYTVTFGGSLAGQSQPLMVATGATGTVANVARVTAGHPTATVVSSGATLQLQGGINVSTDALTLNGIGANPAGGALESVSGVNTWSAPITLGSTSSIGADASSTLIINQAISDNSNGFGVNKVGTGTVQYAGTTSNAYTGLTQVFAGTLQLNKTATLDTQAVALTGTSTGTFSLTFNGQTTSPLAFNATAVQVQTALNSLSSIGGVGGAVGVSLSGNTYTIQFGGAFAGMSEPLMTATGAGGAAATVTRIATGFSPFAIVGNLTIGSGVVTPGSPKTVQLLADNQISTASQALNVNILADGVFDLNNHSQLVNTLTMVGGEVALNGANSKLTLGLGNLTATADASGNPATITGPGTLSLGGSTRNIIVNGTAPVGLTIASVISGVNVEGLVKTGTGTLDLTALNTYTGGTTVGQGEILADGPLTGNTIGAVTLNGGAIGGNGIVASINSSGGTIQPGDSNTSTGTLTSGPVTLDKNSTFFVALNGTGAGQFDQLDVNGDIYLNNANLAGFVGSGVNLGDSFTIIQTTGGSVHGTFSTTGSAGTVFVGGQKFNIVYNSNSVVITSVRDTATVGLSSSANPSVYGQDVLITATITPEAGSGSIPTTDTVTFTIDQGTPTAFTQTVQVAQTTRPCSIRS